MMPRMKASVYVETSVISYATGRLSRSLQVAANQQLTRQWWNTAERDWHLLISPLVIAEVAEGDEKLAEARLKRTKGIESLATTQAVMDCAEYYIKHLLLPRKAYVDAGHLAHAVHYRLDYLVTWNCTHIANGQVLQRLVKLNNLRGWHTPLVVTPAFLIEGGL